MITLILSSKTTKYLIAIFFIAVFLFARSFMGIYIFGFRLGELVMGASLMFLLVALAQHKKLIYTNYLSRELYFTVLLIILFFIFNSIISNSSFTSTYTYKSSSYIWTLGMLFLGVNFFKLNYFNDKLLKSFYFIPLFMYVYGIFGVPQSVVDFTLKYSDKFEPHKGSDLLIIYVAIFLLIIDSLKIEDFI